MNFVSGVWEDISGMIEVNQLYSVRDPGSDKEGVDAVGWGLHPRIQTFAKCSKMF